MYFNFVFSRPSTDDRHHDVKAGLCQQGFVISSASFRDAEFLPTSFSGAAYASLIASPQEYMMADIEIFSPDTLGKPRGQYSQITRASAVQETYYIAGQLSATQAGEIVGDGDFDAQCYQIFANIKTALEAIGAGWENIAQFTTYVVDPRDISKFMAFRLREFPKFFTNGKYPPNTMLVVARLVEEPFLVEVQTIAVK